MNKLLFEMDLFSESKAANQFDSGTNVASAGKMSHNEQIFKNDFGYFYILH